MGSVGLTMITNQSRQHKEWETKKATPSGGKGSELEAKEKLEDLDTKSR